MTQMREHHSNCKLDWKRFSVGDWRGGMTVASGNQNCRKNGSFDTLFSGRKLNLRSDVDIERVVFMC